MAIDQTLPSLNTNIGGENVVSNTASAINLLSPLNKIGDTLINKGVDLYGESQTKKAIQQAYQDAVNGKFSTIEGITGTNKVYNEVINKIAPSVIISKGVADLENLYNQMRLSPNFNPNTASKDYAINAKKIIDSYAKTTSPEWASQVEFGLQKQAFNFGTDINKVILERTFNRQASTTLDAINNLYNQSSNFARQGNIKGAVELNQQRDNIINQAVNAGVLSANQSYSQRKEGRDEILIQTSLNTNEPLPKTLDGVSAEERDAIENKRLALYGQQQKGIEQQQLRNHIDFQQNLDNIVVGNQQTLPFVATDEQLIEANQARRANSFYMQAMNLGNKNKSDIFSNPDFLSLPTKMQHIVLSKINQFDSELNNNPDVALKVNDKPFNVIGDAFVSNNIPLKDLNKTQRFIYYNNMMQTDPAKTILSIKNEAGIYAPFILRSITGKDEFKSLAIDGVTDNAVFLNGLNTKEPPKVNYKKLNTDRLNAMSSLDPYTSQAIQEYISTYSKGNPTLDANDIFSTKFKLLNDKVIYKDDYNYLNSNGTLELLAEKIAKEQNLSKSGIYNSLKNHSIQLNVNGNAYFVLDDSNKPIGVLPRGYLKSVPPVSFIGNIVKSVTDIINTPNEE